MMRTFVVCGILIFCFLAIGCKGFAFRILTEAMLPTLKVEDTCIVDQYSKLEIRRFDIVMFKAPELLQKHLGEGGDLKLISRIIGLPGEKIEIKDNKIFINDKLLDETFEKITDERGFGRNLSALVIPENEYFLMGDNRPNSDDSRFWKPATIKKEDILGKVIEILPADGQK